VLSGSPRLAVNPANAMLNYLYTLLLAESSIAVAAMGLDPGLGYLHADNDYRDSLSCDLMGTGQAPGGRFRVRLDQRQGPKTGVVL
jgi:hypothetical protein